MSTENDFFVFTQVVLLFCVLRLILNDLKEMGKSIQNKKGYNSLNCLHKFSWHVIDQVSLMKNAHDNIILCPDYPTKRYGIILFEFNEITSTTNI